MNVSKFRIHESIFVRCGDYVKPVINKTDVLGDFTAYPHSRILVKDKQHDLFFNTSSRTERKRLQCKFTIL